MGGGIVICKFGNMRLNKDLKKKKTGRLLSTFNIINNSSYYWAYSDLGHYDKSTCDHYKSLWDK